VRVGRRHQLKLGFTGLNRARDGVELQRDFTWGGETYQAGLKASTSTDAEILGGNFKNAGIGVQYKYNRYSYDRGILVSELGGEVTYEGFQVFLSFLF
jgi:hypothetical protein